MTAALLCLAAALPLQSPAPDAETPAFASGFPGVATGYRPQVEIAWNRLYDIDELYAHFDRLVAAFPDWFSMEVIGRSVEGREMRVYTLNDPATGPASEKPAMWIDANVHGNEVQGGEATLYAAWYLLENKGSNARIGALTERAAFYLLPSVNPDGRASWFRDAHNAHSSRTGVLPRDNDGDGLFDEDDVNDLDGDGMIVQMRKYVPGEGTHRLSRNDARILERVPNDDRRLKGDWLLLGSEGIDDDGDGRINEDGKGGYDMNRAWPSMWQPNHVQYGAGPYPLYWPEARSIARFLYAHPNVAAVQSFHNSGGMILRGPGAEAFGTYPAADVAVFDDIGGEAEKMLPFYRYMIIWRDLYSVFGGFATWTYEGLGIISFTNELWARQRPSPDERLDFSQTDRLWFDDYVLSSAGFVDWHPFEHPLYGEVEIGGFRKDVGRVPPTFLIEEMVHRNAIFCIEHAEDMPEVVIASVEKEDLGGGVTAIDIVFENTRAIPSRTAQAAQQKIGAPDTFTLEGEGLEVLAGGFRTDRWRPSRIELAEEEPARLVREGGVPSRGEVRIRWFVRGAGEARIAFRAEKARDVEATVSIP